MFGGVLAFTGFGVSGSDNREWIHRQNVPAWVVQLFSAKGQVYRRSCAEKGRAAENHFGEAIQVEKIRLAAARRPTLIFPASNGPAGTR
jgi:hypothetical protein